MRKTPKTKNILLHPKYSLVIVLLKLNQANVMIGGPSAFGFGSGCLWWRREAGAAEFRVLFNPAVSWTRKPTPPPTNA